MKTVKNKFDFIVVGGGMSGVCAAIAAARHGLHTALIHNRPVLGGNASSEIRMHICGAGIHGARKNARETGIIEEILLENKYRNKNYSYPIFDSVLWEKCRFQENLNLFLNTHIDTVYTEHNFIVGVRGINLCNETEDVLDAGYFMDATGDGYIGAQAGAEFMYGREDISAFDESDAEIVSDEFTMGNSLMFQAKDIGRPVKYIAPDWAYKYTEDDLIYRSHNSIESGYWWIELGGGKLNVITDYENIKDELMKSVYGIWDHIKNCGDHGAENYELDWVGMLPGKRESRRLKGDYVLTEQDCLNSAHFSDTVAYGGWPMDLHIIDGLLSKSEKANKNIHMQNVYEIPYRCLYSKNINNLFIGGRAISCSHLAFSSTRVMATCAVTGQAAGTAAAIASNKKINPRRVGESIGLLQQMLLKDDCYIPKIINCDSEDIAREAFVSSDNFLEGFDSSNLINGYARSTLDENNCYKAAAADKPVISFQFSETKMLNEIHIKFDSNLTREITMTIDRDVKNRQPDFPPELVKSFQIYFYKNKQEIFCVNIEDNRQRFFKYKMNAPIECDMIKLKISETYGEEYAKVFEVRLY